MKRGWIGLALLLILLGAGLLVTWFMGETHEEIADKLEDAGVLALTGDWEGADRLVRRARMEWDKSWRISAALTDHEPMEEIDSLFAQLEIYRRQREALSFGALCAQLSSLLEDLGDAQGLNWWNLL